MKIIVSKEIEQVCPTFVGACVEAMVVNTRYSEELWKEIDEFCERYRQTLTTETLKEMTSISATRKVYKACGKDPSRYRPASEALIRRVLQGKELYQIDTLVDLINLASIAFGYSIGGFDADKFKEHVQVIVDHFDNIKVLPDLNANGSLTLGENIADHGGLMVAYQAFKNATKDAPLKTINGYTPEQRFFMAYAGVWAGNIRDEQIRNQTKSDPHALGRWRVNGTLPHIDAWYDAFGIKPGDALYLAPEKRARIW